MTPNRMKHCLYRNGIMKIFMLMSIMSLVFLLSVLDWGSYNRDHTISLVDLPDYILHTVQSAYYFHG